MSTSSYSPRVAVVTGAAQGIGYSIALRLADDGIDVAVNDIQSKTDALDAVVKEIEAKGRRALAVAGDVSVEADVKALVEKTVEVLGGVDCMIANAGIVPVAPLIDTTTEAMDRCYEVNVRGTLLLYRYAAQQMINQGRGGRLIAASSAAGRLAMPNLSAYSTSKFAVRGLTQAAALELAQYNITANTYAPGWIFTPLVATTSESAGAGGQSQEEQSAAMIKLFGMPEHTKGAPPETVASVVSYLCKPEAYFVTGQTISMDGGLRPS